MTDQSTMWGQIVELEHEIVAPYASSLVESLRAFSYQIHTAIADLVDNSISAGARNVWIDFHWAGEESVIAVTDDGRGMSEAQLLDAMRMGSRNPLAKRSATDFGRFGLGLKTASFSQCRRVTVWSRAGGQSASRCWDLDHIATVNDWQLLRGAEKTIAPFMRRLPSSAPGTTVVWENLDRLVARQAVDDEHAQQVFLQRADAVRTHLGMVFHQLMADSPGTKLFLNERQIRAWDPFLSEDPATQSLPVTRLRFRGAVVEVEPFVLPHHSKLSKSQHEAAGGPHGWIAHQGFYVYRNRRLIAPGDWLGLGWTKDDHYKLARIRVEIPNSLDPDWAIDVTKSRAVPPAALREALRKIGERVRSDAKRVYSHRGAKLTPVLDAERVFLWEPRARHGKAFYSLNRDHPLLKHVQACSSDRPALNALLKLIEATIPVTNITIQNSEAPESIPSPFQSTPDKQVREVMEQAFESLVQSGYSATDAVNRLRTIWPFELFDALLQSLAESKNHG